MRMRDERNHGPGPLPLEPIGKERAPHPPHPSFNPVAIMHMVFGEEVGGARIASDRDSIQKGGSCPAYRGPVQ